MWTREGWVYLAVILDLHSRRVIGWAISNRMKKNLAIRALNMAIALRRSPKACIHHTDRPSRSLKANRCRATGSQYCSHDYQKILKKHGLTASMSGKGNCYDRAMDAIGSSPMARAAVESFFKSLKAEMVWRKNWQTRREVEVALFPSHGLQANHCRATEYINGFDNPRRRHSALGWKSPVVFERKAA